MRIGDQPIIQPPGPAAKAAPAKPAAAPQMGGDTFSANPEAVNVVSFNAAGGASAFKLEEKLAETPIMQKLIKGSPDAPIVAVQETTPALAKKLIEESKNGNFEVIWPGPSWLPKAVPISTIAQGNMLLVPKRYHIEKSETKSFAGRAGNFFKALKGLVFGGGKANDLVLALQNRGYVSASLKDSKTGKRFNVFASHVAYKDDQRRQQTQELVAALEKAKGPTVLMGDVNVPSPEPGVKLSADHQDFWKMLEPAGLADMGPTGEAGASYWKNGANIDVVLARGFKSESAQMLEGEAMAIPGKPDAKQISDHYAEADSLIFE